ncbi:MAG: ribosomal-protein-alanine acetyltransferase [Candidatus Peregrinibacteria bacterium Gr01-1014_25]|nr:MAG: ribosomal-protein-alanine acetyltransferase [Candidatus Peregrinibacteria bacterium Gr01-1014_25]
MSLPLYDCTKKADAVGETMNDKLHAHIRWMIRRDLPEVLAIEQASFEPDQWTEDDFLTTMRQHNVIGMVAEYDEKVVGSMLYELHKTTIRLATMAVDPRYRRKGIGTQMIQRLCGKLKSHRRNVLDVGIPTETAEAAIPFFEQNRFQHVAGVESATVEPPTSPPSDELDYADMFFSAFERIPELQQALVQTVHSYERENGCVLHELPQPKVEWKPLRREGKLMRYTLSHAAAIPEADFVVANDGSCRK